VAEIGTGTVLGLHHRIDPSCSHRHPIRILRFYNLVGKTARIIIVVRGCRWAVRSYGHPSRPCRDHVNYLFAEFVKRERNDGGGINDDAAVALLTPQAQESLALLTETTAAAPKGKWGTLLQRLVQRTNEWSRRTIMHREQPTQEETAQSSINFWMPVHLTSSQLPKDSSPAHHPGQPKLRLLGNIAHQQILSNCSNVAIVGWDTVSYSREGRRDALQKCMSTTRIQSSSIPATTTAPMPIQKQYLLLSVNDLQSILDAARESPSSVPIW